MEILGKIKDKINHKQADSVINIKRDVINFTMETNNFLDKLTHQIITHTKTNLTSHFNNVLEYLITDSHIESASQQKKNEASEAKGNATVGLKSKEIQVNHNQKRSVIISEKQMPKKEINYSKINIEQNIEGIDDIIKEKQRVEGNHHKKNEYSDYLFHNSKDTPLNSVQQKQKILQTNELKRNSQPKRYNPSRQTRQDKIINKRKEVQSNSILKRETIKELQEKKKIKNTSQQPKSKKIRTRLIKLSPIALQKQKQERQKQASEKLQAAIQFLNNIQTKKKTSSYKISQWKQSKSNVQPLNKILSSPINYNFKKKHIVYVNKYEMSMSLDSQSQQKAYHLISHRKKDKLKNTNEKQFVLEKPPPYNLQHINLSKNEQFLLKFS